MSKQKAYEYVTKHADTFSHLSSQIWDFAETAFEEEKSAEVLANALEEFGFVVNREVADVPNAFVGTWGNDGPVFGFLGEFDALSGMSQEAGITEKKSLPTGGNGHGCGHNYLGVGALAAAVALKDHLETTGKPGTVKYFGTPGEEGGSGKAFMARAGVFDGVDIALTWHPANFNGTFDVSTLANYQVRYTFTGQSAHAAAAPHLGRSALDAVELMNVGVQFLREHIIPEARVHYAITNTGGISPNVVQSKAEVLYLMRTPKLNQLDDIYQRINKIAHGMAMATETEVKIDFIKSCADVVTNKTLSTILQKNMHEAPKPIYTEEELAFAQRMEDTLDAQPNLQSTCNISSDDATNVINDMKGKPLFEGILPFYPEREVPICPISTDVGDVSQIIPTGQVFTSSWSFKTPLHAWQTVSQCKSSVGDKGMLYAAQTLVGAAIDILDDPTIIAQAKQEHNKRMGDHPYKCPIPMDVKPKPLSQL